MAKGARYVFRPVVLCCVLSAGGLLLLVLGLKLIMALRGLRLMLGLAALFVAGLLFLAVYLLGRCAEIVDEQGVRTRGIIGDWRQLRWEEIVSVTRKHSVHEDRADGQTFLIFAGRQGEEISILGNDRVLELIGKYGPESKLGQE